MARRSADRVGSGRLACRHRSRQRRPDLRTNAIVRGSVDGASSWGDNARPASRLFDSAYDSAGNNASECQRIWEVERV